MFSDDSTKKRKKAESSVSDLMPDFDSCLASGSVTPPPSKERKEKNPRYETVSNLPQFVQSPLKTKYYFKKTIGRGNFGRVDEYQSLQGGDRVVKWELSPQTVKQKRAPRGYNHVKMLALAAKARRAGLFGYLICNGEGLGRQKCSQPHGIMMPKIPGEHLDTFFRGKLSEQTLQDSFRTLLKMSIATIDALSTYHAEVKSVHCDIKPDNFHIIINKEGLKVHVLDVDSSVDVGEEVDDSEMNRKFCDPELLQGGLFIFHRAQYRNDIYSVGRMMEEFLKMHRAKDKSATMRAKHELFEDVIVGMKRQREKAPVAYTFDQAKEKLKEALAATVLHSFRL